jgi:regulator of PEP synthase PpsR (kinase-PPPase family)
MDWEMIDVTRRAIEEVSLEILECCGFVNEEDDWLGNARSE